MGFFNALIQMRCSCPARRKGIFGHGTVVLMEDCNRLLKMLSDVTGGRQLFTGFSSGMKC